MRTLIADVHAALAAVRAAADPRRATVAALQAYHANLDSDTRLHLLAIGKASLEMSFAALEAVGERIEGGLIAAVPRRLEALEAVALRTLRDHRIEALPCDHPLATQRNLDFADQARDFVASTPADRRLLALISGGGSAHLASPPPGITLSDLRAVTDTMLRAGAPIGELNTVRKHIETLKGGRLVLLCPAPVDTFIISDVIGDRIDIIASGPFAPDPTTFAQALEALDRRGAVHVSPAITRHLTQGTLGANAETPKPGESAFGRVTNRVIASNDVAVRAVIEALTPKSVSGFREERGIEAPVEAVAERIVRLATHHSIVVVGGEWTVHTGDSTGLGGPSQELALRVALLMEQRRFAHPFAFLAYSTDGVDGPTDAAGAIVTSDTLGVARSRGFDPGAALANHDSHAFFAGIGDAAEHLRAGPTGTNINHVGLLVMHPR